MRILSFLFSLLFISVVFSIENYSTPITNMALNFCDYYNNIPIISDTPELNFNTDRNFSVEVWVNLAKNYWDFPIISKITGKYPHIKGYMLYLDKSNRLTAVIADGVNIYSISSKTVVDNDYPEFYQIALTVDRNGYAQLYLNGVTDGVAVNISACKNISNNAEFWVGIFKHYGCYEMFLGDEYEIRISNTVRSDKEIAYSYEHNSYLNYDNNTIALWYLNENGCFYIANEKNTLIDTTIAIYETATLKRNFSQKDSLFITSILGKVPDLILTQRRMIKFKVDTISNINYSHTNLEDMPPDVSYYVIPSEFAYHIVINFHKDSKMQIFITDSLGRKVWKQPVRNYKKGTVSFQWMLHENTPVGVYFLNIISKNKKSVDKIFISKQMLQCMFHSARLNK